MWKWCYKFFMVREIRDFFSFKKGEVFGKLASFFTVCGLLIQLAVIVCSFFYSKNQFGQPDVIPLMYIVFTIISLIGYRSYIAIALSLALFLSAFQGQNLFTHPAFYHILGMILYVAGWTEVRHLHPKKTDPQNTDAFKYNEHLCYSIEHTVVLGVSRQNVVNGTRVTLQESKTPFVWEINRPKTGKDTFLRDCPICGKPLKLIDVHSSELVMAKRKRAKKRLRIWNIIFFNFLFGLVLFLFPHPPRMDSLLIAIALAACISFVVYMSYIGYMEGVKSPNSRSGIPVGFYGSDIKSLSDGHSINSISGTQAF